MKFATGLVAGIAIGAVGAVIYSVRTGQDLRQTFEQVRAEIEKRDAEVLGGRLAEIETQLEERIAEVRATAAPALEEASAQLEGARAVASDAYDRVRGKADTAVDDATEAVESATAPEGDLATVVDDAIAGAEDTANGTAAEVEAATESLDTDPA